MSAITREERARAAKASALADACRAHGITASVAARMDQDGRDALAALHDVRKPSERTWSVVVGILRYREEHDADPFQGIAP